MWKAGRKWAQVWGFSPNPLRSGPEMSFSTSPSPDSPKETVRPAGWGGGRQELHRAFVPASSSNQPKASFQYICMKWFHPRVGASLPPSPTLECPQAPGPTSGPFGWCHIYQEEFLLFLHPRYHKSYITFSPSTLMLNSLHSMGSHWGVFSRRGCGGICNLKAALVTSEGQGWRQGNHWGE